MSEKPGTRLGDWSKRKLAAKAAEQETKAAPPPAPVDDASSSDALAELNLPDIETLDKDSDFTPFLDARVPELLQRQALRKLWVSDPVFSMSDGLNDYDPTQMSFLEQISKSAQAVLTKAIKEEQARIEAARDAEPTDELRPSSEDALAEPSSSVADEPDADVEAGVPVPASPVADKA